MNPLLIASIINTTNNPYIPADIPIHKLLSVSMPCVNPPHNIEKNIIETSINYKNELYYQIKQEHKHYIKCIKCHKKEEINICPVEDLEKKGFKIITHTIEIDGICNKCQEK